MRALQVAEPLVLVAPLGLNPFSLHSALHQPLPVVDEASLRVAPARGWVGPQTLRHSRRSGPHLHTKTHTQRDQRGTMIKSSS